MKAQATTIRTINLGYEQMLLLDGGPDTRVRVLFGGTWLTDEGGGGDAFVRAGEEVTLHGGRVLLEGLAPTRLQIVEPSAPGLGQRLWRRLQRSGRSLRQLAERLHLGRPAVAPYA